MHDSQPSLTPTPTPTNYNKNDEQTSNSSRPTGYAHLSNLMSHHPELAIFRRFSNLNIQNLLYLQAELTHLEEDLEKLVQRDRTIKGRGEVWDRYWWFLSKGVEVVLDGNDQDSHEQEEKNESGEEAGEDEGIEIVENESHEEKEVEEERKFIDDDASSNRRSNSSEQWELWLKIREVLKEYNSTLAHLSTLSPALLSPSGSQNYNLTFLRSWLTRPRMGNFPLDGPDHASWSQTHEHDLLSLSPGSGPSSASPSYGREPTPLSRFLIYRFIPFFHNLIGSHLPCITPVSHDPESEITDYPDGTLHGIIRVLVIVVASLIPVASIVVLYFVERTIDRLGVCVAFTGVFAFALAVTTRARGVEVWAGSCAFAAVQVVFITGNGT